MKYLLATMVILTVGFVQGQVLVGGGASLQNGLNTGYTGFGLNAYVEIPSSTTSTFLVRLKYLNFSDKIDVMGYENEFATPGEDLLTAKYVNKNNLFDLTVGRRAYFINDYDIGFSMYGGIFIGLSIAPTKQEVRGYDVFYQEEPAPGFSREEFPNDPYLYFYLKTEFNGGFCYNLPLGNALFFDAGLDYILLSNAGTSPSAGTEYFTNRLGGFNFSVNLGYRHTIF